MQFIFCVGYSSTRMDEPVISNFVLSPDKNAVTDDPIAYVQVISFPKSHVWIWVGDQSGMQQNLSLAMGSRQKENGEIMSSHVLNSAKIDETSIHGKGLAERISKKLLGKPVYLSCAISANTADNQYLDNLEKQILRLVKTSPHVFGV